MDQYLNPTGKVIITFEKNILKIEGNLKIILRPF